MLNPEFRNIKKSENSSATLKSVLRIQIRNPVPFWPLDPKAWMGKNQISGSGMNIPDHISESLETNFWVKILEFFMRIRDPESFRQWIRQNSDTGSGIKIPGFATLIKMSAYYFDTWNAGDTSLQSLHPGPGRRRIPPLPAIATWCTAAGSSGPIWESRPNQVLNSVKLY